MYVIITYYTNFTTPTASAVDQSLQNLYFVSDGFLHIGWLLKT